MRLYKIMTDFEYECNKPYRYMTPLDVNDISSTELHFVKIYGYTYDSGYNSGYIIFNIDFEGEYNGLEYDARTELKSISLGIKRDKVIENLLNESI